MKKSFIILLAIITAISCVFVSCSSNDEDANASTENTVANEGSGLDDSDSEYGFETQEVTDENGKTVTDKDGNALTEDVQVIYKKDSKGKYYAQLIDEETGEGVTNSKGQPVTIKSEIAEEMNTSTTASGTTKIVDSNKTTTKSNSTTAISADTTESKSTTIPPTTGTTNKNADLTSQKDTTKFDEDKTVVPKTSATGTQVNFSEGDMAVLANMLKVPKLCEKSYENEDGVPIEIATYTALWMCERNSLSGNTPSGPVVLDLFRFYGQTVVNFKSKCNESAKAVGADITYDKSSDTFTVGSCPSADHDIVITKIEDLGNNNFYKVTANVKNCDNAKKVIAIVQKNKLDINLGFSIKALKWSK